MVTTPQQEKPETLDTRDDRAIADAFARELQRLIGGHTLVAATAILAAINRCLECQGQCQGACPHGTTWPRMH